MNTETSTESTEFFHTTDILLASFIVAKANLPYSVEGGESPYYTVRFRFYNNPTLQATVRQWEEQDNLINGRRILEVARDLRRAIGEKIRSGEGRNWTLPERSHTEGRRPQMITKQNRESRG